MPELPSALFVTTTSDPPEQLIFKTLGSLPQTESLLDGVKSYEWYIDNKYYEADVHVHAISNRSDCTRKLLESAQALVVFFSNDCSSALEDIRSWNNAFSHCEAEVKLLVCSDCDDKEGGVSRSTISQWCLDEGFELVELEGDDAEDSGPCRVRQALEAHMWPNLRQKSARAQASQASGNRLSRDNVEPSAEELLEAESDFCNLFGQLANIKEQASRLSNDERKTFAEQVVLAYWKSIGGDEDEILDC